MHLKQSLVDYERIRQAIEFITENRDRQPNLDEIAAHVHLSPYHFQRLFQRWAGVSPKKFLQFITLEYAKEKLKQDLNLADVAFESGLSGGSRLHDLFVKFEGMTPDQYRKGGQDITIYYGFHTGPFGRYLLAVTDRDRICNLLFCETEDLALKEIRELWHNSEIISDQERTGSISTRIFDMDNSSPLQLLAVGSPFQLKVWEALLRIPFGSVVSYQAIAVALNKPGGLQAVGSAVGSNRIAYLIPCHRVIRKAGNISEYKWGRNRKISMIGWEEARMVQERFKR